MVKPPQLFQSWLQKNSKGKGRRVSTRRSRKQLNASSRASRDGMPISVVRYTPNVFGFPHVLLTKLRYHDTLTLTSSLGAVQAQQFRWNSTFDPDYTNAGHQPLYRDTYAAIYDQYAVVSAKAKIEIINTSSTLLAFVGVQTDDSTSYTSGFNTIAEQSTAKSYCLGVTGNANSSKVFNISWNCKEVLGIDPYTSESYKTSVGSNPTEVSFLNVFNATTVGSNNTVTLNVMLEQVVLWTELTTPTGS